MKIKLFLALVSFFVLPVALATSYTAPTNYDIPEQFSLSEIPDWFSESAYTCPKVWNFDQNDFLYDVDTLEVKQAFVSPKGEGENSFSGVVTTLTSRIGVPYENLEAFNEVAEAREGTNVMTASLAPVTYTLSKDGKDWYYYSETNQKWQKSNGHYEQSSTAALINLHLDDFNTRLGQGKLFFKAYLKSQMAYAEGSSGSKTWSWWNDWFGFGSGSGMGWKIYKPYLSQVSIECSSSSADTPSFEELDLAHVFDEISDFSWQAFFNGWVADFEIDAEECTEQGEMYALYPGAAPCCEGFVPIGVMEPMLDGTCPESPIVGAAICTACGDGVCGLGENKCNCPSDCKTQEFDDVPHTHANYNAIMTLKEQGIIQGIGTLFYPNKVTTRAEAFKIALGGKVDVSGYYYVDNPFVDLPDDHTLKAYVLYLYTQGVISGYDANHVGPDNPLTVAEAAKLLLNLNEIELGEAPVGVTYGLPSDSDLISYVHTGMQKNILYFDGENLDPSTGKLRAWMVEDMYRIINLE